MHDTQTLPPPPPGNAVLITSPAEVMGDGNARKALWGAAIGRIMAGFDLMVLGFLLAPLTQGLDLTLAESASLATATLIGSVLGGIGFGMLADRRGRISLLPWTIVLFAVSSGLCALAQGYGDLFLYRTIAGFGLGGEYGIGMALVVASRPAAKRSTAALDIGRHIGLLLAAAAIPLLLPRLRWRWMFALGILPAMLAYTLRALFHEPEVFMPKVESTSPGAFLKTAGKQIAAARRLWGLALLCSVQYAGYYGALLWLPGYLTLELGFGLAQAALWTALAIGGMLCGTFVFGLFAKKAGGRPAVVCSMVGAAVTVSLYALLSDPVPLLAVGAAMGFFIQGMLSGQKFLTRTFFPEAAHTTAHNALLAVGAITGSFGPAIVGGVCAWVGFSAAFATLAALLLVGVITTVFLLPMPQAAPEDHP